MFHNPFPSRKVPITIMDVLLKN